MNDAELVARYVESGSTEAFNALMVRYVDLVYQAARRQVRDVHLAEDVTQAVFILLSQKAGTFRGIGSLAGWLLLTTHYAAKDARKRQFRRRVYEGKAAQMQKTRNQEREEAKEGAELELDAALAKLREKQRSILALRFMEGRTFREVGDALGMSEDAARVACDRAIASLRRSLKIPEKGTASLGLVLASTAKMQGASRELRAAILAHHATGQTASITALAIARGAASGLWAKAGAAVLVGVVALMSGLAVTGLALLWKSTAQQPVMASRLPVAMEDHLAIEKGVQFVNGANVEFLGAARYPEARGVWWHADGSGGASATWPAGLGAGRVDVPEQTDRTWYQFALRITKLPEGAGDLRMYAAGEFAGVADVRMQRGEGDVYYGVAALSPEQRITNLAVALSMGRTESMRLDRSGQVIEAATGDLNGFVPEKILGEAGRTVLVLPASNDPFIRQDFTAVAVGGDGAEHPRLMSAAPYCGLIGDGSRRSVLTFDVDPGEVREFRITVARSRDWLTFRHVSLGTGVQTDAYAERAKAPTDHSTLDRMYLAMVENMVQEIRSGDVAAARTACDELAAETRKREELFNSTQYRYVVTDGAPALDRLQSALHRGDLAAALAIVDAGSPSGERLWEMMWGLSIETPAESLRYP